MKRSRSRAKLFPAQKIKVIGVLDRQTDGATPAKTNTETVMHNLHYPWSSLWNQDVVSVEIIIAN